LRSACSYHVVLLLQNRQESNGRKMVKGTCLAALQRRTGTPRRLGPGSPQRAAPVQRYLM
jgi:hypothetical protein